MRAILQNLGACKASAAQSTRRLRTGTLEFFPLRSHSSTRQCHWLPICASGTLGVVGLVLIDKPVLAKPPEAQHEVYVWGRSQSIPGGAKQDVLLPQRVSWFDGHPSQIAKVSFGPNFGAALDCQGFLIVWGEGIDETKPIGPFTTNMQGNAKGHIFSDVQCSSTKVFVLTKSGHTFIVDDVLDTLREHSKTAASSEPVALTGRSVPGLPQPSGFSRVWGGGGVKQMSIGLEHAAFVTRGGELFTVGGNQWGQCGEPPPKQKGPRGALEDRDRVEIETPVRVQLPDSAAPIASVTVGGRHTIALDTAGRVFSFGDDRRIQLGLGDTRTGGTDERHSYGVLHQDALGGKQAKTEMKRAVQYRYYDPHMQSSPIETVAPIVYNRPPYPSPSFIACGEDFTIAAHRDSPDWYAQDQETNVLICCGENGEGQCGRSLQQQQQAWTPVKLPKRSKTLKVECGQSHCIALMSSGELYAWGANQEGQVGNGKRASVSRPVRVARGTDAPIVAVSAPMVQTGDSSVRPPPALGVELPGKIIDISCGFRNSALICDTSHGKLEQRH